MLQTLKDHLQEAYCNSVANKTSVVHILLNQTAAQLLCTSSLTFLYRYASFACLARENFVLFTFAR